MTCRTIAEKGFKCPRLISGDCTAKFPAALCGDPLGIKELRERLSALQSNQAAVEKVEDDREFTATYLCDVEPAIADAFLNYEVKAHLKLKSGDVKALVALRRDMYKKHRGSKNLELGESLAELPGWYETAGRGGLRFSPAPSPNTWPGKQKPSTAPSSITFTKTACTALPPTWPQGTSCAPASYQGTPP
jgi:putative DNA primase/helicase